MSDSQMFQERIETKYRRRRYKSNKLYSNQFQYPWIFKKMYTGTDMKVVTCYHRLKLLNR